MSSPFWHFAKRMLRYKGTLFWALVFAFISAGGLGAGLVSLGPIMRLILEKGQSLAQLAQNYNAGDPAVEIPTWLVEQLPNDAFGGVVLLIVGLGVLTVIGATTNFLHEFLSITVVTKTIAGVRRDCFRRVIHMPLGRIVTRGPSEFIARIIRDAAELQSGLVALTGKSVAQITKGVAAFLAACWFSWQLSVIALIVMPALGITLRKLGNRIRRGTRGSLRAQEDLLRIASESLHGLRAVKASTGERAAAARFHERNKRVVQQELRVRLAKAISSPVVEFLALLVIGVLAIIAARQIIAGRLPFTDFIMAIGSLAAAGASFKPLAGLVNKIQAADAPAERLMEILAQPRETSRTEHRYSLPRHRESLEFDHVTYSYDDADEPAVRDVSLMIRHGERIAIVGPNGCGKTTLLSLVPRLLSPQTGRVLIDGVDIATVNLRSLRRQIGVVTQETVLFRGSVAENIAFGAGGVSREEIIDAARRAHAHEFITTLPEGYDAPIAEYGASLSGGQRQRLAIARAILREPSILILDEATSQIDSESEALINQAINEFGDGRTTLIIAHRLSTVLTADRIVVMDAGRVVDEGRHEELLERCAVYRRIAHHQFLPPAVEVEAPERGREQADHAAPVSGAAERPR